MKKILYFSLVLALGFFATSCIDSLNTMPLNETDFTSERAYSTEEGYIQGLTKVYHSFTNNRDLTVSDMGASELLRAFFNINECSTDECKSAMQADSWVKDINNNIWSSAENAATYAIYARSMHGITYANEYLRQTTDEKMDARGQDAALKSKVHGMRNEARILRAVFYWFLMDAFGSVPFVTEESEFGTYIPDMYTRTQIFEWLETEVKDLMASSDTPAPRSNYPRADKGTAAALLLRMYINAEVYTGNARWADAQKLAEEIFTYGYKLSPKYSYLFAGDNGENPDANQEFLFAIYYDADKLNGKWGGTIYMMAGGGSQADEPTDENGNVIGFNQGTKDHWSSIRTTYEWATSHFDITDINYETGTYNVNDDRGKHFFIKGHQQEMTDISNFQHGWAVHKYTNVPHNETIYSFYEQAAKLSYSNVDWPLFRYAEVYLNYAEACLRLGQPEKGLPYVNAIRERANASKVDSYDADWLLEERSREFYWEGLRRIDLIRFDKFCSGSYLWPYKGGSYAGQAIPEFRKIFAFPPTEMNSNPKLVQNPGY